MQCLSGTISYHKRTKIHLSNFVNVHKLFLIPLYKVHIHNGLNKWNENKNEIKCTMKGLASFVLFWTVTDVVDTQIALLLRVTQICIARYC